MARFDVFDTIDRLRAEGAAFCVATVIRTADATSAKAGAKAAVTASGKILGHLGGACVQRAVRAASEEALEQGTPRMIRVKPSAKVVDLVDADGVQVFKSGCPSGGTVDLLIEPWSPSSRLVIYGDTPISRALAAHGALAGFRVMLAEGADSGGVDVARFDPAVENPLVLDSGDFVVVAAQGQGDAAALEAALSTAARRVSMVASRRKAQVLADKLVAKGLDPSRVAQLKSPAGLKIDAIDPHEIAISILAEIVAWRNADAATDPADTRQEDRA